MRERYIITAYISDSADRVETMRLPETIARDKQIANLIRSDRIAILENEILYI